MDETQPQKSQENTGVLDIPDDHMSLLNGPSKVRTHRGTLGFRKLLDVTTNSIQVVEQVMPIQDHLGLSSRETTTNDHPRRRRPDRR